MASLEDIKVGDKVVIRPPSNFQPRMLAVVETVTRTQFVAGGYRFRKRDGGNITKDKWYRAHAYHPTPELLAEVEAESRYTKAHENLTKMRHQLETLTREIDRTHDNHRLAEAMEAAAADVAAGIAKLQEALA